MKTLIFRELARPGLLERLVLPAVPVPVRGGLARLVRRVRRADRALEQAPRPGPARRPEWADCFGYIRSKPLWRPTEATY